MNYISAKEIGEKWGMSKTRVCVLARAGRIEGAKKVADRWMIPENAQKPPDGRSEQKPTERIDAEEPFFFPLLICQKAEDIAQLVDSGSEEEQLLYRAQQMLLAGHFKESYSLLSKVLRKTLNLIIRTVALYYLCITLFCLGKVERFQSAYFELKLVISTLLPKWQELQFLLTDLEAYFKGIETYIDDFSIDPVHSYPKEILPFLCMQSMYTSLMRKTVNNERCDLNPYELQCQWMEREGYLLAAERTNLYLSMYDYSCNENEKGNWHLQRTLELAQRTHDYLCIVEVYQFIAPYVDETIKRLPAKEADAIHSVIAQYWTNVQAFFKSSAKEAIAFQLDLLDVKLIICAQMGETIKEISAELKLSSSTIRRKYTRIYQILGVNNKAEMIKHYQEISKNY